MTHPILIRPETAADHAAIFEVTAAAFLHHPISQHTEQYIIEALRAAGALTLSLVAEQEGRVVGHIAFSPVTICGGVQHWHGVGPVSVLPERQRRGIGKALIREGLARLKALGSQGCVLAGDPNYYQRFGFRHIPELVLEGIPPQYFLALPLGETTPRGTVVFHAGFTATGPAASPSSPSHVAGAGQ